jgi:hypothetical protein
MSKSRHDSDEQYVIDLCDKVLRSKGHRQHKFGFLVGDPGKNGKCRRLPVDAYYEDAKLVIEYRELQHISSVKHFDKPHILTCSGCHRGEQRRRYDERRREFIPANGLALVELSFLMFEHNSQKRLRRIPTTDEAVIRQELQAFV